MEKDFENQKNSVKDEVVETTVETNQTYYLALIIAQDTSHIKWPLVCKGPCKVCQSVSTVR